MATHSSTPPRVAEALLDRARRLSSNAYERTLVPTSFAEGEMPRSHLSVHSPNQHRTSLNNSLLSSPRRSSFVVPPRPRSATNAPSSSLSHSSASAPSSKNHYTSGAAQIVSAPIIICNNSSENGEPTKVEFPNESPAKDHPVLDEEDQSRNSTITTFPNLNQPCATTTDPQPPATMSSAARPRALSLESIYEARGSEDAADTIRVPGDAAQDGAGHLSVARDTRRKHVSENGTPSLVYGVLAMLRQNSGLESPRIMDDTDLSVASTIPLTTVMMTASDKDIKTEAIEPVEQQPQQQEQVQVQEEQTIMHTTDATNTNTAAALIDVVTVAAANHVNEDLKASQEVLDDTLATDKVTPVAPDPTSTPTLETMESQSIAAEERSEVCSQEAMMESPVQEDRGKEDLFSSTPEASLPAVRSAPNSRSSTMNSTSSVDHHHEKKEGKASSLLHRISALRKNSAGESSKEGSDGTSLKSHSSHLSLHSKASKRSSKLLGKLVPKFLHTTPSTHSSTSTSGSSPRSQTGFSPFSHHSNHSGSVTDQSSVHEVMTPDSASFVMIPSPVSETYGSLPFEPVVQVEPAVQEPEEVTSPTFATVVAPAFLECLRSDTQSPSLSLGRRSSCSSGVSKTSDNSYASKPSGSSVISVYSAEEETKELTAIATTGLKLQSNTNAQNNEEEKGRKEDNDKAPENTIIHSALDDTLMSPYIIDENCDDVFFLNSVLRKKTPPNSTSSTMDSGLLSSSYTSSWTMNSNSMQSCASTPSVSGCSTMSSQASTPSPTSPSQLDDQVYPFPPGHSLKSTMHMHYRSSPLPTNIPDGLDEKRTRLRDAVSEWRRSANASS